MKLSQYMQMALDLARGGDGTLVYRKGGWWTRPDAVEQAAGLTWGAPYKDHVPTNTIQALVGRKLLEVVERDAKRSSWLVVRVVSQELTDGEQTAKAPVVTTGGPMPNPRDDFRATLDAEHRRLQEEVARWCAVVALDPFEAMSGAGWAQRGMDIVAEQAVLKMFDRDRPSTPDEALRSLQGCERIHNQACGREAIPSGRAGDLLAASQQAQDARRPGGSGMDEALDRWFRGWRGRLVKLAANTPAPAGAAGAFSEPRWSPQPLDSYDCLQRTGYLAGYSDGWHGYHFGAGYDDPPPTYRTAFEQAQRDAGRIA